MQVIAVSSAATAFAYMRDVPALTLASWRLQLTAVLLSIGAVYEYRQLSAGTTRQPNKFAMHAHCFGLWRDAGRA